MGPHRTGDTPQEPVLCLVPAATVGSLELVDVDERHNQRFTVALGTAQVTLELQQTGVAEIGAGELIS